MSAIGIGDDGFPSSIVHSVLPIFRAPEGDSLNPGVAEKGGVVTFGFPCRLSILVVSQKF
jgi:hypothetical protein